MPFFQFVRIVALGSGLAILAAGNVLAQDARSAKDIYTTKCALCHASGAAGAPRTDDNKVWAERVEAKGMDTLYKNAWEGFKAMPPRGMCTDCSREEIEAVVDYMVKPASKDSGS